MNKTQVIAEARRLIADGKLEEALEHLLAFLQNNNEFRPYYTLALQAKSLLEKAQSDEAQGLISYENAKINFSQVTKQTLQLLDYWESSTLPPNAEGASFRWWWVALPLAILGLGALIWILTKPDEPVEPLVDELECPFDKDSSFKALVLPFKPLDGKLTKIHSAIQSRLSNLSDQFGIEASIKVLEIDVEDDNEYPSNNKEAAAIGNTCKAKLVIWGSTEKKAEQDFVQTRFKFLNLGEHFKLLKLSVTEGMDIDTLSSLSSISTEGILTEKVEATMKLLFGLIAHETNNDKVAAEFLAQAETTDSTSILLKGMTLAGINAAAGRTDKALANLDTVLQTHPDYALARNNRASLLYIKGEYAEAATDMNVVIEKQPDNFAARAIRASAYIKSSQLDKAALDIEAIERSQPLDTVIKSGQESKGSPTSTDVKPSAVDELRKAYQSKLKAEELKKSKAEEVLKENPDNIKALRTKSESSRNLGDFRTAAATAQQILKKDPTNVHAYATLIESADALRNEETVKTTIAKAQKMGITKAKLIEARPALKEILAQKKQ